MSYARLGVGQIILLESDLTRLLLSYYGSLIALITQKYREDRQTIVTCSGQIFF